jgi:hypothetical protein
MKKFVIETILKVSLILISYSLLVKMLIYTYSLYKLVAK